MVTSKILKKQIAIIKKSRAEEEEKKRLEAELAGLKGGRKLKAFAEKHKKKIAIVKTFGVGAGRIGRGLGIMGKGIIKGVRESKGLQRQYDQMYGPQQPRRKLIVVKKKKKR